MSFVSISNSSVTSSMLFPSSNRLITCLIASAIEAAITANGKQTFCDDPTALNSNLFPVYANGLVLFLSVSYWRRSYDKFGKDLFKLLLYFGDTLSTIAET